MLRMGLDSWVPQDAVSVVTMLTIPAYKVPSALPVGVRPVSASLKSGRVTVLSGSAPQLALLVSWMPPGTTELQGSSTGSPRSAPTLSPPPQEGEGAAALPVLCAAAGSSRGEQQRAFARSPAPKA